MLKFLKTHAAKTGYNIVSFAGPGRCGPYGGKYLVPDSDLDELFGLLALRHGDMEMNALVPMAAHKPQLFHLIDLDFDFDEEFVVPDYMYQHFFEAVLKALPDQKARCVVLCPERPFYAKNGKFHTGVHGYLMVNRVVSKSESLAFRERNLALVREYFADTPGFTDEAVPKIWDHAISSRQSGTAIAWTCKASSSPKSPRYILVKRGDEVQTMGGKSCTDVFEKLDARVDLLTQLYKNQISNTLLEAPIVELVQKIPEVHPEMTNEALACTIVHTDIQNEDGFNASEFIRWARQKGWGTTVPIQRDDWKTIVAYCACCGLDARVWGEQLTLLFDPEGKYAPRENEKLMRNIQANYDPSIRTRKTSVTNVLERVFPNQFSTKRFWTPKQKYRFYDEYEQFKYGTGPHEQHEFQRFISETVRFIADSKQYSFMYQKKVRDKAGNVYVCANRKNDDKLPWATATDEFDILVYPTSEEFAGVVKKMRPSGKTMRSEPSDADKKLDAACAKMLEALKSATAHEQRLQICEPLGIELEPYTVSSKKLVLKYHRRCQIKRYITMDYYPYLEQDPTPDTTYNTWERFPLLSYRAKKKIDVRTTKCWELLYTILSSQDDGVFKLLLDFLAWKAQKPHLKFGRGRIFICRSVKQGCGKSSYYFFLQKIFGEANCSMVASLKAMLADFNAHLSGQLFLFVDDIDSAKSSETGKLKARITMDRVSYVAKNKMPFWMRCCEAYITTSNATTPLYANHEDRRQLYLPIDGRYAAKKNPASVLFFNQLYAEFDNLDVMKAWFEFFRTRDITGVTGHQSDDPKKCQELFCEQSEDCMPLPHQFAQTFFANDSFIKLYKRPREDRWFDRYDLTQNRNGKSVLMIKNDALEVYNRWVKATQPRSKATKEKHFLNALAEIGIKPNKRDFNGRQARGVLSFNNKKIAKGLKSLYGSSCTIEEWAGDEEWKYLDGCLSNDCSVMTVRQLAFVEEAEGESMEMEE
jgi:hypothetical protein